MIRKILALLVTVAAFLGGAAAGDMLGDGATGTEAAEAPAEAAGAAGADGHGAAADDKGDADAAAGHGGATDAGAKTPAGDDGHATKPKATGDKPAAAAASHGDAGGHGASGGHGGSGDPAAPAWFKFPQQFFVPVLHDGQLDSTMVLSLSLEMPGAASETVYAHEIKLRDALLRQLLIHANTGGFDGNFTSDVHLSGLRTSLAKVAQEVVPEITGVLIGDIARQQF